MIDTIFYYLSWLKWRQYQCVCDRLWIILFDLDIFDQTNFFLPSITSSRFTIFTVMSSTYYMQYRSWMGLENRVFLNHPRHLTHYYVMSLRLDGIVLLYEKQNYDERWFHKSGIISLSHCILPHFLDYNPILVLKFLFFY